MDDFAGEPEENRRQARRAAMETIRVAALDAVDPRSAVLSALRRDGDNLVVGDRRVDLGEVARIFVLGAGKAGAPMAQAVEERLGERISDGLVVVKEGHTAPTQRVRLAEAGHPLPTQAGLDVGAELLALAESAGPNDLVVCLISGGGSALLEVLPPGLSLADLQATTALLLASGATIAEINTLRKHLSLLKGGRLAAAVAPADLIALVLSDVVGSPLETIASGPTVPDRTTWADAWAIVQSLGVVDHLPAAVIAHLTAGLAGDLPDTPRAEHPAFARASSHIVADNAVAAEAARRCAQSLGFEAVVLTTTMEGEAAQVALRIVDEASERRSERGPGKPSLCLIWGGETTVTLGASPGKGGRNQELALAAALVLEDTMGITLMALATDGTDGPTDSAGAVVDGRSAQRARELGFDPVAACTAHDAYALLARTGDLLRTGPTLTNVNDLVVVLLE